MEHEPGPEQIHLTGIHINLQAQAIVFEDHHGTVGRLVFGGETVLYEGRPLLLLPSGDPANPTERPAPPGPDRPLPPTPAEPMIHNPSPQPPRTAF
ncbi:MAG TPA: hypothetical protein VKV26_22540 [Dehalococcoidia bacterium]|nr:hypothetical protein [Dehalococcoidia bacterium]